jgi:hypothetical protein
MFVPSSAKPASSSPIRGRFPLPTRKQVSAFSTDLPRRTTVAKRWEPLPILKARGSSGF